MKYIPLQYSCLGVMIAQRCADGETIIIGVEFPPEGMQQQVLADYSPDDSFHQSANDRHALFAT